MSDTGRILRGNLAAHAGSARRAMGLDVEVVARLAGLDAPAIAAAESGKSDEIPTEDLARLAQFLGLTADGTPRPAPPGRVDPARA